MRLTAILATLAAGAACAAAPLELADHPLAGRIWDVAAQRFVDVDEARARAAQADYLLLGETHDNARHHELQAALVGEMVTRGHRPAIVMEPIDREHQGALDSAVAAGTGAAELGAAAQVSRGWDWALYAPIVALALAHRLPLVAGNLSSADARKVASGGFEAVQPGAARSLGIEAAWTGERAKVLRHELVEGHCGEDGPRIDAMALMQRARDAVLADRILSKPRAVAILGRGHARADIGVPLYLRERAPGKGVLSLAFVEVRRDAERPGDYDEATPGRHDLAWFTPRAGRADPCAAFRARPKPAP